MSHTAWNAVIPHLSSARRVIAFDIPGFGSTPPLPDCTPPTIANLVDSLENSLHDIGIEPPVDFSGNSLGGCMALEAARRGIARSVVPFHPRGCGESVNRLMSNTCLESCDSWRRISRGF
jgi:surfactin synthase thioesterase subunit